MKPSIVLVGLDRTFVNNVLQGFLGEKSIEGQPLIDWRIDTKYYIADVQICPLTSKSLVDQSVAESSEVLILLLDPNEVRNDSKSKEILLKKKSSIVDQQSNKT